MLSDNDNPQPNLGRHNQTGLSAHPQQSQELLLTGRSTECILGSSSSGALAAQRLDYAREQAPGGIGSVAAGAPSESTRRVANKLAIPPLLDKLGERLQFERSGVRLYEALLTKRSLLDRLEPDEADDHGRITLPPVEDLLRIRDEELAHCTLMHQAVELLGADPTTVTPSADVAAVIAEGLIKVVADSRTDLAQALLAVLTAELQDNEGWGLLIALTQPVLPELLPALREALREEDRHLQQVRRWLFGLTALVNC